MKGRATRRIIGAGAIVAGALFMWLSPEQALLGVVLMVAGIALEIIGIALERR
jgi:drug/metabolite transporter (DMT)-like permease